MKVMSKSILRVFQKVRVIDIPDEEKVCCCCGAREKKFIEVQTAQPKTKRV